MVLWPLSHRTSSCARPLAARPCQRHRTSLRRTGRHHGLLAPRQTSCRVTSTRFARPLPRGFLADPRARAPARLANLHAPATGTACRLGLGNAETGLTAGSPAPEPLPPLPVAEPAHCYRRASLLLLHTAESAAVLNSCRCTSAPTHDRRRLRLLCSHARPSQGPRAAFHDRPAAAEPQAHLHARGR